MIGVKNHKLDSKMFHGILVSKLTTIHFVRTVIAKVVVLFLNTEEVN
jgi:hypothetical protein